MHGNAKIQSFSDPQTLMALADYHVEQCRAEERQITYSGMLKALGLNSRQALHKIANYSEEWSEAVDYARLLIAESYEKDLRGNNATGPIFALKQLGWSDRQEIDHTSSDGSLSSVQVSAEDVQALVSKLVG